MKILFDKINLNYKKIKAVDNFSHEFMPGIYGLIGENGAGKTTLMNIMAGLFLPASGTISVNDAPINTRSADYLRLIGYLPQVNPMYPEFTVYEHMKYVSYLKCIKKDKEKEIDYLLELVNLKDKKKEKCKTLSGGMKRRLGIAQSLIGNPKFLILDEPTAGVDVMERMHFRNIISQLGKDCIIIFSTHTISDVERIANDIIILNKGKMICSGTIVDMLCRLEKRVWEAEVKQLDYEKIVSECTEKKITNVNVSNYIFKVRYVCNYPIVEGAKNVPPSLEDVYADVMG